MDGHRKMVLLAYFLGLFNRRHAITFPVGSVVAEKIRPILVAGDHAANDDKEGRLILWDTNWPRGQFACCDLAP